MAYIGRGLSTGQYTKLDSISDSFNGSTTSFNLTRSSTTVTPSAQNLLISIDGVIQEPLDAFSVTGSVINFSTAPGDGATFFGIMMGDAAFIAGDSVAAGELGVTAGTAKASKAAVLGTGKDISDLGNVSGSSVSTSSFGRVHLGGGVLELKNQGAQSEVRLYCESANAHYVSLKAPAHANFSGDATLTLPATTGDLPSSAAVSGSFAQKSAVSSSISEPAANVSGSSASTGSFGRLEVGGVGPVGGWVKIESSTVTGAGETSVVVGSMDSTYGLYMFVIKNMNPETDGQALIAQYKIGGSVITATNYNGHTIRSHAGSSDYSGENNTGYKGLKLCDQAEATSGFVTDITLFMAHPSDTSTYKSCWWNGIGNEGGDNITFANGIGYYDSGTLAVTDISFYMDSGNILTGTFTVYGLVGS